MRIWQVVSDEKAEVDAGGGRFYARSKKALMQAIRENEWNLEQCTIYSIEVEPNKDSIIRALNNSQF